MSKIPTAEEILTKYNGNDSWTNNEDAKDAMIEFAKLHVEEALNIASTNAVTKTIQVYNGGLDPDKLSMYDDMEEIDKDSILNAYPLDRIE